MLQTKMKENVPVNICPNSHTFQDRGDVFSCLYIKTTVQCAIREFWHLRRSCLRVICFTKHRCNAPLVFPLRFTSTLGRCNSSSTKAYMFHVQCTCTVQRGTISLVSHYQAVPEPDLRCTVYSTWNPSQMVCRIRFR